MSRGNSFAFVLAIVFFVGMAQYAPTAIDSIVNGNVQLWTLDSSALDDVGPTRYLKDLFVFGFGMYWPIRIGSARYPNGTGRMVSAYLIWLLSICALGVVAFIFQFSPIFFLPAGLRWLALLHCSFGLFLMAKDLPQSNRIQNKILWLFILFAALDAYVVLKQFSVGAAFAGIGFAEGRITGLFSNAGIAGMFGLALAVLALVFDQGRSLQRWLLIGLSLFIALSSGTRFAVLSIALLGTMMFWDISVKKAYRNYRLLLTVVASPLLLAAGIVGYSALINAVGRGDAVGTQLEEGGRIYNLLSIISNLGGASLPELFVGRGLGLGTNTAVGYLMAQGIDPNQYRFNWQIDDAFITLIFQVGLLGLTIFLCGMFAFFWKIRPRASKEMRSRYFAFVAITLLICFGGNLFENYFLMTSLFIGFGDVYWKDIARRSEGRWSLGSHNRITQSTA